MNVDIIIQSGTCLNELIPQKGTIMYYDIYTISNTIIQDIIDNPGNSIHMIPHTEANPVLHLFTAYTGGYIIIYDIDTQNSYPQDHYIHAHNHNQVIDVLTNYNIVKIVIYISSINMIMRSQLKTHFYIKTTSKLMNKMMLSQTPTRDTPTPTADRINTNPNDIFLEMIHVQKQKEDKSDIWKYSPYKDLVKLQSNNVGIVGETFIKQICDTCNISAQVDGTKTKELGGGCGDGLILNKSVEIKTSHRGCSSPNFQHELGEVPWKSDMMIFIDIAPACIYLTIFNNFNESFYKSGKKCDPYFPTKSITWRKKSGAFKLDTTVSINDENIKKGNTFKIDNEISIDTLKEFILSKFK